MLSVVDGGAHSVKPILRLTSITKQYPGVVALENVDLDIAPGSVHALMGENGAGKSTLGKVICGLTKADSGAIQVDGTTVQFNHPGEAVQCGIGMVHQELLFCENMSVAENLCLGTYPRKGMFVDRAEMEKRAKVALAAVGASINPKTMLGALSVAQQQLVQIASAVSKGARILIFDEPTSSLSHLESERLFELIDQLKADGVTCIYVSHRMPEIFRLCDTITVLRDGKHIATRPVTEFDHDSLVATMIGREIDLKSAGERCFGSVVLCVRDLASPGKFSGVSFELREGEILGLAGLVGAGRTEILEALFGLDPLVTGTVDTHGTSMSLGKTRQAISRRIGLVPEDRKRHGLVLGMRIRENETLPVLPTLAQAGFVNFRKERCLAQNYFERLRVKAPTIETSTGGLSGGNQQKVVLAKWLAAECDILMVDEPTRGVDIGAKAEIHEILWKLAEAGKAILMVSSELPELIKVADRILVFREGRMVGEVVCADATEDRLVRMMAGV